MPEKTNSELLREIDEALSNAVGQQDDIMSLIEKNKTDDETPEPENEMEINDMDEKSPEEEPIPEIDTEENSETVETAISDPILPSKDVQPEETPEQTHATKLETKRSKLRSLLGELPEMKPLSCDSSFVIDLETGDVVKKELTGPELLKEKYVQNAIVKSQVPHDTDLQIVSMENGLHVEHVMVKPDVDTFKVKKDVKPGAAYVKLREELERKMTESRMKSVQEREGYAKKLEEEQAQYSGDEDDEEKSDVEEAESDVEAVEFEEPENGLEEDEPDEMDCVEETEPGDDEKQQSDSSSDSSDDEEESLPDPVTDTSKKSRIITAFVDSDDETEEKSKQDLNISTNTLQEADISLSDSLPLGQAIPSDKEGSFLETSFKVPETPTEDRQRTESLWDDPNDRSKDDEDLSELCSGRFGPTQAPVSAFTQENSATGIKALCDKGLTQAINDEDLSDLCSGAFVSQVDVAKSITDDKKSEQEETEFVQTEQISKRNVIVSSDEESKEKDESISEKKIKKLKKKRRRQALEISGKVSNLNFF